MVRSRLTPKRWGRLVPLLVALALVLAGFAAGAFVATTLGPAAAAGALGAERELALVREAWQVANQHFVFRDRVPPRELERGAVRGLVDALGDEGHTRYLTPDEWKLEQSELQARLEGIGAEVSAREGRPVIVAPIEGSPAERAGLRPGDVIIRVEGEDTARLSLSEVIRRIRGPAGTAVTLTILRPGTNQTRELRIVREALKIKLVNWTMIPGTRFAHIHVTHFAEGAGEELRQALMAARQHDAAGIILDLRNDPGGLLPEAIAVASQFLDSGNVLLEADASGNRKTYAVEPGGLTTDLPLVVLINNGSASAAEIVAGAVKDHGRAHLIGVRSFGTGTVLSSFKLSDGSVILLGVAEWLTPNGEHIWHRGVEPDTVVELADGVQPLLPREEQRLNEADLATRGDGQLLRAIEALRAKIAPPVAATP